MINAAKRVIFAAFNSTLLECRNFGAFSFHVVFPMFHCTANNGMMPCTGKLNFHRYLILQCYPTHQISCMQK